MALYLYSSQFNLWIIEKVYKYQGGMNIEDVQSYLINHPRRKSLKTINIGKSDEEISFSHFLIISILLDLEFGGSKRGEFEEWIKGNHEELGVDINLWNEENE